MTETLSTVLPKNQEVKAATDLKGVPEGTQGRIMLSNGLSWIRYWVKFDNGIEMGSLHRDKLVRVDEWDRYLQDRESGVLVPETVAKGLDEDNTGDASSGEVEVNGVMVPQLLLDRTKSALERFGVTR
jgi:hypothetical protein